MIPRGPTADKFAVGFFDKDHARTKTDHDPIQVNRIMVGAARFYTAIGALIAASGS
jgi:hypothetical protein